MTFAALGVHGATVLTGATAQNSVAVTAIERLSTPFLRHQLDAVFDDFRPRAVKIGALFDAARIRVVAAALRRHHATNVVLDPVLASSSGKRLLARGGLATLRGVLIPLCDLATPNLPEAEELTGMQIRTPSDRRLAAGLILDMGAGAVLLKGGHGRGREVRDLLFDGRFFTEFVAPRIRTRATHGTGCRLSSAIAANLALGHGLEAAIVAAIAWLRTGLAGGLFPGRGRGVPAPLRATGIQKR